jgi:hypothetical protein
MSTIATMQNTCRICLKMAQVCSEGIQASMVSIGKKQRIASIFRQTSKIGKQ